MDCEELGRIPTLRNEPFSIIGAGWTTVVLKVRCRRLEERAVRSADDPHLLCSTEVCSIGVPFSVYCPRSPSKMLGGCVVKSFGTLWASNSFEMSVVRHSKRPMKAAGYVESIFGVAGRGKIVVVVMAVLGVDRPEPPNSLLVG